jgi:single-strand DNA-binding protein
MLNKVMLIGNVGKDPDIRHLESGTAVANLTLATTERYKDRNGEMQEQTEWHNVVLWRGLADVTERFVRKGSQIFIEGKIRTRSWEDQSGQKRYTTEIVADNMQLLGRRSDNPANASARPARNDQSSFDNGAADFSPEEVDDLPF